MPQAQDSTLTKSAGKIPACSLGINIDSNGVGRNRAFSAAIDARQD